VTRDLQHRQRHHYQHRHRHRQHQQQRRRQRQPSHRHHQHLPRRTATRVQHRRRLTLRCRCCWSMAWATPLMCVRGGGGAWVGDVVCCVHHVVCDDDVTHCTSCATGAAHGRHRSAAQAVHGRVQAQHDAHSAERRVIGNDTCSSTDHSNRPDDHDNTVVTARACAHLDCAGGVVST
jgi:hypothetical protein